MYVNHRVETNPYYFSPQFKNKSFEPSGTMRLLLRTLLLRTVIGNGPVLFNFHQALGTCNNKIDRIILFGTNLIKC
jgi:hypothetical protein